MMGLSFLYADADLSFLYTEGQELQPMISGKILRADAAGNTELK